MTAPWTVRVYAEKFTEPVSAMAWSDDEAAAFLSEIARDNGPGTLVELVNSAGEVVASSALNGGRL